MDVYGIIFIYELLKYYSGMLGITFGSFSIETHTDKGVKFNDIRWSEVDDYIKDLLKGYNLQYQKLVREYIKEKKGVVNAVAEQMIRNTNPFTPEIGFFNIWLGEDGTAAERSIVQPLPWVVVNHIVRVTGCTAKMKSSVDNYEYSVTAYFDHFSAYSDNTQKAEKTEYKYILSRIVNEKVTTLTYNQLAKNECPQEISAIFRKANKMLDRLRETKDHEHVNGITVRDFIAELNKYIDQKDRYLNVWNQVYEPFNISNRPGVYKIDPAVDGQEIIDMTYA